MADLIILRIDLNIVPDLEAEEILAWEIQIEEEN